MSDKVNIPDEIAKSKCAPGVKYDKVLNTCFSEEKLKLYVKEYNKYNPKNKIPLLNDKQKLYRGLQSKLLPLCGNNEACYVDQQFIDDPELINTFKPKKPKGKYDWLSTLDIFKVLKQYEIKYPNFEFIGAVPIDFDYIYKDICKFNLADFLKKKDCVGIVFNTDPSTASGEHWISMFIDFRETGNEQINFFDSVGEKPPKEVMSLIKRLKKQSMDIGRKATVKVNTIKHQRKNTECGVYSINFIVSQLLGYSFEEVVKNKIDDDNMNKRRDAFFRK